MLTPRVIIATFVGLGVIGVGTGLYLADSAPTPGVQSLYNDTYWGPSPVPTPDVTLPKPSPTKAKAKPTPKATTAKPTPKPVVVVPRVKPNVAVAVLDTTTGKSYYSSTRVFDTASIVKVDILAALLLRSQELGDPFTPKELNLSERAITKSDNAAATELWQDLGGTMPLDMRNQQLELNETHAGNGQYWGLTKTTAWDQVKLLHQLTNDGPLTQDSRDYELGLMGHVVAGQDWGVSAAGSAQLKNGWLERSQTKRWDVNSIGVVNHKGHKLLMAVLSNDNATLQSGIDLVEKSAVNAADRITG
jgi:beta-lactamase class A